MTLEIHWPCWSVILEAVEKIKKACKNKEHKFEIDGITCRQDHEKFILELSNHSLSVKKVELVYDFVTDYNPKDFQVVNIFFKDGTIWRINNREIGLILFFKDKDQKSEDKEKLVVVKIWWLAETPNTPLIGELSSIKVEFIDHSDTLQIPHVFALNTKSHKSVIEFMHILGKNFDFEFIEKIDPDKKVSELLELSYLFTIADQL